jgi:hypothetical protein
MSAPITAHSTHMKESPMTVQPDDKISVLELLELSNNERLGRAVAAAERIAENTARLADATETLTALLASVIGLGKSTCYPSNSNGPTTQSAVFFLRTGDGNKAFACDANNADFDDGE